MHWKVSGKSGLNSCNMKKEVNIETWNRKDHYHFYSAFDEPFFGVNVRVDVTRIVTNEESIFLQYVHAAAKAVNAVENFRLRIQEEKVMLYDAINVSVTIAREDKTFDFSYIKYHEDYAVFRASAQKEMERIKASTGLNPNVAEDDVVHYSTLPWLDFTSMSHARSFSFPDSCPKISFGKISEKNGRYSMPVSIHVHHGLVDGYHVGKFVEVLQGILEGEE